MTPGRFASVDHETKHPENHDGNKENGRDNRKWLWKHSGFHDPEYSIGVDVLSGGAYTYCALTLCEQSRSAD